MIHGVLVPKSYVHESDEVHRHRQEKAAKLPKDLARTTSLLARTADTNK